MVFTAKREMASKAGEVLLESSHSRVKEVMVNNEVLAASADCVASVINTGEHWFGFMLGSQ